MIEWVWTPARLQKLADILVGLGHIMFGSVVVPFFFESFDVVRGIFGVLFAIAFWIVGLVILDEKLWN